MREREKSIYPKVGLQIAISLFKYTYFNCKLESFLP